MRELFRINSFKDAVAVTVTFIFLFEMFYYVRLVKRRAEEDKEFTKTMDSMGVSPTDFWVSQHAYITRESIVKLRENSCKPPIVNPFNPVMFQYFKPYKRNCTDYKQFYFKAHVKENGTDIQNMILMYRQKPSKLKCCYEQLRFGKTFPYRPINLPTDWCLFFNENQTVVPADSHYLIIKCWNVEKHDNKPENILIKYFPHHYEILFYIPRPNREILYKKSSYWATHPVGEGEEPLNVIIFGLDEVSRANFIRLMQKTFQYLKSDLNTIDLQGFNKMGDATLNNTLAVLTGQDFGSIQRNAQWFPRTLEETDAVFDECPWIWKNFSEKGYITAYADDYTSVFNYRFRGFTRQPTDYYLEPFVHWYHNFHMKRWDKFGTYDCLGNELAVDLLQDQARKMAAAMKGLPYFHFLWVSRTHERQGYPALVDQSMLETLKHFESTGLLNKSLVILLSDHGWRAGPIMTYPQARIENRLSFAFILLPRWFQDKYSQAYQNLQENQYRLTTPYDIHATLGDILDHANLISNGAINSRTTHATNSKGTSLFLPISKERSCADANIDEEWCACTDYQPFSVDSPKAKQLGKFAVDTLNAWLKPYPLCYQYSLNKMYLAEVTTITLNNAPSTLGTGRQERHQFRLSFSVLPEDQEARFEVTIFTDAEYWWSGNSSHISMSTEVFRLNRYGNAACINVYSLKKICTCKPF